MKERTEPTLGDLELGGMMTRQDMVEAGWNMDIEFPDDGEDDFLLGKTCNPDAPEECESCQ